MALAVTDDPVTAAVSAGLVYVTDEEPGIRRIRRGRGFSYVDESGRTLAGEERDRVESLAIPPAWTDVWICPDPDGHLQATGRDVRGRKQYRYHDRWREVRDAAKFHRLADFGAALTTIRRRVDDDLSLRSVSRAKALAITVALLDETLVRVGNEEYVRSNGSYGLTTLRPEHVEVTATTVRIAFPGKGGQDVEVAVSDRRLARAVQRCEEIPGQCLFTYEDGDDGPRRVESGDVNDWLEETTGERFTAKDFRTWGGTVVAAARLAEFGDPGDVDAADANVLAATDAAAERLGNTRQVARTSYVHPALAVAYREGELTRAFRAARSRRWLARDEVAVLSVLEWAAS